MECSPRTPKICRIVLVTKDKLIIEATNSRIAQFGNATVVDDLEELRGLINTLVSEIGEDFLAILKPEARKLFFVPKDKSTLYYKENIKGLISEKFAPELSSLPKGAMSRTNLSWVIGNPNFVKKAKQRVYWATRVNIKAKASKRVAATQLSPYLTETRTPSGGLSSLGRLFATTPPAYQSSAGSLLGLGSLGSEAVYQIATTHMGIDSYEVNWSALITIRNELRRARIEGIRHVESD